MATDLGVGDSETPTMLVAPADNSTTVTLTAIAPDGTSSPITVAAGVPEPITGSADLQQRWTADPVTYTQPGRWVLHWVVTGTGQGAEDAEVYVAAPPVAGGPAWAPGRSRVANYLPHRTLVRDLSGTLGSQDVLLMTWDETTTPTGVQVDRLIADAVAYISARLTPLHSDSEPAAAVLCCLYTAAMVERSWPHDDQSLPRANDLEKRLDVMLGDLARANSDVNQAGGVQYPVAAPQPYWSFPAADLRYDDSGYW